MSRGPTLYNGSMSTEYFEDIKLHQRYRSREYHLNEKEIIDFAKEWYPQPFYIDPEFARNAKFGGLSAAAIHLLAICAKLVNERRPRMACVASLGWDGIRFEATARPGDVLVFEDEVISKRESKSDPNAGVVRYAARLLKKHNEPVLTYEGTVLVEKRHKL